MPTRKVAGAEAEVPKEEAVDVAMAPEALPEEAPEELLGALPVVQPKEEGVTAALPVLPPRAQAGKSAETSFKEGACGRVASFGILQLAGFTRKEAAN